MGAPSSLTVALPACFLRASGGALIDYGDIVTHYSVFVKPLFHFFQGARFFFCSVLYTHILAIMCAI